MDDASFQLEHPPPTTHDGIAPDFHFVDGLTQEFPQVHRIGVLQRLTEPCEESHRIVDLGADVR